jgi:NNP family nitrate/nitrite transporter-like MFS transporter
MPKGSTYFKPKKSGAMEVTSTGNLYFYILMTMPLYQALTLLTWKLSSAIGVNLVSKPFAVGIYILPAATIAEN